MDMLERLFPKIPLGEIVVSFVDFLKQALSGLFNVITNSIEFLSTRCFSLLDIHPSFIMIGVLALSAWWIANSTLRIFTLICLALINNLEYCSDTIQSLFLVLISFV